MRHRLTSAVVAATALLGGMAVSGAARAVPAQVAPEPSGPQPSASGATVPEQNASAACPPAMAARQDGSLAVSSGRDGTGVPDGLAVHLRDKTTGLRVASVDAFRKVADPDGISPGFQLISEPLKLAALGIYGLELGPDSDPVSCGDFDYRLRAVVTKVDAADGVSLDHLTTTVSADVTTLDPRTGASAPLKNTKVRLAVERTAQEATTDAQGHLSAPFTFRGTENHTDVSVEVLDTPEIMAGSRAETARAVRQKAEIVLDPESRKIKTRYGSTVTITGRAVRIAPDGTRVPVPEGTPVRADLTGEPKTGSDGRFARQVRAAHGGSVKTTWAGGRSPWLRYVSVGTDVEVVEVSYFREVEATVDAAGVRFTGALTHKPLSQTPALIEVQQSADGKTDWKTRTVFTVDFTTARFDQTLPGQANGYWRLRYAAAAHMPGSVTEPVRLTRTATAFTKYNAYPEPVRVGQQFTIRGTLSHGDPAKSYADQTVLFYFQPAGSGEYVLKGSATTNARGNFATKFTAEATGTWIARYGDSDGKHLNAESRRDDLTVNP